MGWGTLGEVRNGSRDSRGGPGQIVGLLDRSMMGRGTSGKCGTGCGVVGRDGGPSGRSESSWGPSGRSGTGRGP